MKFFKRANGKLVLTSRITLIPGPHDRLIEIIEATPNGQLAPVLRELLRRGLETVAAPDRQAQAAIHDLLQSDYDQSRIPYSTIFSPVSEPAWQRLP